VLPEVAEKCLNHTEESRVKRTYQRHSYNAEKREAWRLLGERLELLTRSDDNVVALKRRNKSSESLTANAVIGGEMLGMDRAAIVTVVKSLTMQDFYKSKTTRSVTGLATNPASPAPSLSHHVLNHAVTR
jgi:hypothetical protein